MNGGPHWRLSSPEGGGSTFTTSAPMSARSIVQTGPDRIRERSTTNRSSSGFILRFSLTILHEKLTASLSSFWIVFGAFSEIILLTRDQVFLFMDNLR